MTNQDVAGFGHLVVDLTTATDLGRMRARTADLLLASLTGEIEVTDDRQPPVLLHPGQVLVLPRGRVWSARAPHGPTRLLVVAVPAGAEQVVAAFCADPPMPPNSRLTLALEEGVELLL